MIRITKQQADDLAFYLKDEISTFVRDNREAYVAYLMAVKDNDPQAHKEYLKLTCDEHKEVGGG